MQINKKIVAGIAVSLVIAAGAVEVAWNWQVINDLFTSKKVQAISMEDISSNFAADVQDRAVPSEWWENDGYSDADTWLVALSEKKNNADGLTQVAIEEWGGYLSDEQKQRLQEIEDTIQESHSIKECDELLAEFSEIIATATAAYHKVVSVETRDYGGSASNSGGSYTGATSDFKRDGVINQDGWRYTWYSQNVLPGGGLDIPGRHVGDDNLIYDADGYIVVAANRADLEAGATVSTPFGEGKVYDTGCAQGTIDIYTNF